MQRQLTRAQEPAQTIDARGYAPLRPHVRAAAHPPVRLLILVGVVLDACPKCGMQRRDEPACPRCGLAAARMGTFSRASDAAVPPSLHIAWQRASEHWAVSHHHDELLQLAVQHECFAWLAAKYRDVGRTRDTDQTIQVYLGRVRRAAEVTLAVTGARHPEQAARSSYRAAKTTLILLLLLVVVSGVFARVRPIAAGAAPSATLEIVEAR